MDKEEIAGAILNKLSMEDDIGLNDISHIRGMFELKERRGEVDTVPNKVV